MLGGHLDSWHAATGATDNAIGCAMMMEAARILQAIGVKPRRTIRVALWSGEEQGLLGSQAYVKEHFGTVEDPKPEYANFAGYFNIDSGTGRVRGADGVRAARGGAILSRGARAVRGPRHARRDATQSRRRGGTDSTSFNEAGLPGIGIEPGSDRVQLAHLAHQPRHLRAHHRRRREEVGDGDRRGGVSPGDARRAAAAVHERRDAAAAGSAATSSTNAGAELRGRAVQDELVGARARPITRRALLGALFLAVAALPSRFAAGNRAATSQWPFLGFPRRSRMSKRVSSGRRLSGYRVCRSRWASSVSPE